MNSIIADLNAAMSKKQLVNIYLNTGDIFYTGYIETYNDDEVIIATYESSGLADGYVAMKTAIIESVERQSEDLDSIKEKKDIENVDELSSIIEEFKAKF